MSCTTQMVHNVAHANSDAATWNESQSQSQSFDLTQSQTSQESFYCHPFDKRGRPKPLTARQLQRYQQARDKAAKAWRESNQIFALYASLKNKK